MPRQPKAAAPAPPPEIRFHIRWMIRRDMDEVLAIEAGSSPWPWSEEDFLRCLRQRNCIGMIAEPVLADARPGDPPPPVVGFMIYELHNARLHVLNLAVHPLWRRRGVGRALTAKLASKLRSHRRVAVVIEVRETNLAAQLFLAGQGYRALQVQRGFYEDSGEDAYVMAHQLPTAAEELLAVNRIAALGE